MYAVCLFNTGGTTDRVGDQAQVGGGQIGHAIATCPPGTIVTGGGFAGRANGSLYIYNSSPEDNGWEVYAENTTGNTIPLNAYAVCLSGTSGTTNFEHDSTSIPAGTTGNAEASCPSGLVTGGGFAGSDDMIYIGSYSTDSDTWRIRARNITGSGGLGAQILCLTFP